MEIPTNMVLVTEGGVAWEIRGESEQYGAVEGRGGGGSSGNLWRV